MLTFPLEERTANKNEKIVTVTVKVWYVSDFDAKSRKVDYVKVDKNCVDCRDCKGGCSSCTPWCERTSNVNSLTLKDTIPQNMISSWDNDTPLNRAQAVIL